MNQASSPSPAHTPGPWRATKAECKDVYGLDEHDAVIADDVHTDEPGRMVADICPCGNKNESAANARLIAAAPHLLVACQLALKALNDPDSDDPRLIADLETALESAIGNAEGLSGIERRPRHRVLITVKSGVAEYAADPDVEVCVLDLDNDSKPRIPAEYADLA